MARSRALDLWREGAGRRPRADRLKVVVADEEPRAEDRPALMAERDDAGRAPSARRSRRLPDAQREALVLAYWGGLTADEIARRIEVPLGTAKSRIRLGLAKLRAECALAHAVLLPCTLCDFSPRDRRGRLLGSNASSATPSRGRTTPPRAGEELSTGPHRRGRAPRRQTRPMKPRRCLVLRLSPLRRGLFAVALGTTMTGAGAVPAPAQDGTRARDRSPTATIAKVGVDKRKLERARRPQGRRARHRAARAPRGCVASLQVRRSGRWITLDRDRTGTSGRYRLRDKRTGADERARARARPRRRPTAPGAASAA